MFPVNLATNGVGHYYTGKLFLMVQLTGNMEQFTGLFNLPGEGFVAQIRNGTDARLYDRQGLQHLILERKQAGKDVHALEEALIRMNSVGEALQLQDA